MKEFSDYNVRYTTLEDLRNRPDLQPTVCKDCGVATEPGKGSARCPACWEDRCGNGGQIMQLDKFIEGLMILQTYYDDPEGYHIGAGHDQFYAYATDKPLPEIQVKRMFELGWFQPEVETDEDAEVKNYDPNEGWSAFT